ncbi:MAG: hypothetical protein IPJ81_02230 [Chitinophagaceae bacterium]|nr:hypothetical protein [Chitinophagaceae bacterium]
MKYLLIVLFAFSQLQTIAQDKTGAKIKIQWVDNLPGDFSFAKKWSYPENVFKNEFGQLVCDGFCSEELDKMRDSAGRIYEDSLHAYYKLLDTTHQFHTLKADAWCYEYAGTNFIECSKDWDTNELDCSTLSNAGTHCNLLLESDMQQKYFYPVVMLNSINGRTTFFQCSSGTIKIDKKSLKKGILKAVFDFKFINTIDKSKPIFWKGKILSPIASVGPGC